MLGIDRDEVKLFEYNPKWKEEYLKEESKLKKILSDYIIDIQHVGSTSIPGILAKPIIDIAIAVLNKEKLQEIIPIMEKNNYFVVNSIEDKGEVLAIIGEITRRTHYIHIEVINGEYWNNHILFRDYLINNKEYILEYQNLKVNLSKKFFNNRVEYTAQKSEFIKKIINLAKEELNK